MIKYLLFDLDGTILDFKLAEKEAFKNTIFYFTKYIVSEEEIIEYSNINECLFNEYAVGKMKRIEFQEERFKKISIKLKLNIDCCAANKYFLDSLKKHVFLYEPMYFLNKLKRKYRLFIATNGIKTIQRERLKKAGIDFFFDEIYASEEIGANKPDIKFFDYIFNDLNDYDKSHYVIIGDRLETDILGGFNSGIKTVLVDRDNINKNNQPDYVIKSLKELENLFL